MESQENKKPKAWQQTLEELKKIAELLNWSFEEKTNSEAK